MQTSDALPDPLRILHLEDHPEDAERARAALLADLYHPQITRVETLQAFLDALQKQSWDVVLADCSLRNLDPFDALNLTRRQSPDTPFLFLSGAPDEELALKALRSGATEYLFKTQMRRLGPAVRRALLEAREREARRQAEARNNAFSERAEAALRASENHYRLLFENNPTPISHV